MVYNCIDVAISHRPFACNPSQLSLTPRSTGDVDGPEDNGGAPRPEQHLDEDLRPPSLDLDADGANHPAAGLSATIFVWVEKRRPRVDAADRVSFRSVYSRRPYDEGASTGMIAISWRGAADHDKEVCGASRSGGILQHFRKRKPALRDRGPAASLAKC